MTDKLVSLAARAIIADKVLYMMEATTNKAVT